MTVGRCKANCVPAEVKNNSAKVGLRYERDKEEEGGSFGGASGSPVVVGKGMAVQTTPRCCPACPHSRGHWHGGGTAARQGRTSW
jgi:hypothetical protein